MAVWEDELCILFELIDIIMFKQRQRREQQPQSVEQGGRGDGLCAFGLPPADAHQKVLNFKRLRAGRRRQLPHQHTGATGHHQALGNGHRIILQPVLMAAHFRRNLAAPFFQA